MIIDFTVVAVGLQQEVYEVSEGNETQTLVLVCTELNGQIERDIFVTLSTLETAGALG